MIGELTVGVSCQSPG